MAPPPGHTGVIKVPVQLRLSQEDLALVDAFADELSLRGFGAAFSRAEALRIAAMEWLRQRQRDSVVILEPAVVEEIAQSIPDSAGLPDPVAEGLTPETPPAPTPAEPALSVFLPNKAELAARVRELRQTLSHTKIAALFMSEGLPTPGGTAGAKWSNSMIARLEKFDV